MGFSLWLPQSSSSKQSYFLASDLINHTEINNNNYANKYTFGEYIDSLEGHTRGINDITVSPNSTLLASCDDKEIMLWDIRTHELQKILDLHTTGRFTDLAFSPDGSTLAISDVSWDDDYVRLVNISSEEVIVNISGGGNCLAFSPDGLQLAVGTGDDIGGGATIYNTHNGTPVFDLVHQSSHDKGVKSVDFSPNGSYIVTGHHDMEEDLFDSESLKLWNASGGNFIRTLSDYSGTINVVKFAPSGKLIAATGMDRRVRLWDIDGNSLWNKSDHSSSISSLDISPFGSILATGDISPGLIKIRNLTNGNVIEVLDIHTSTLSSLAFSPDGSILVSASADQTIKLWNMIQAIEKEEIPIPFEDLGSSTMSLDGMKIAAGGSDGRIFLWNRKSRNPDIRSHNGSIKSVAFSPNGSLLASASALGTIKIWSINSQDQLNEIHHLDENQGSVYSLAFSSNGSLLASSSNNIIRIWDVNTGKEKLNHTEHRGEINSVEFSPTGDLLASGGKYWNSGSILIYNISKQSEVSSLAWSDSYGAWPLSLAFSPDGTMLVAGGRENNNTKNIRVWDVTDEGVKEKEYSPITNQLEEIKSVSFSLNNKVLASGSSDGTLKWWNTSTGAPLYSFPEETIGITSLTFSSTNYTFASTSGEVVTIWDLNSIPSDYDGDGMPDGWELEYSFDRLEWGDKFDDFDSDGLINSLECFIKTKPNDTDTDNDRIPDGWEYLKQLDPLVDDSNLDTDSDGMLNYYEYLWDFNPLFDESSEDYDNDGLSNLQEFENGWLNPFSNDTDGDEMPDPWEVQMGLNGSDSSDAIHDKDEDGMENLWEYQNGFNASNSLDASQDPDGDWISNLDEFRSDTNPRDKNSSPCFVYSFPFISIHVFDFFLRVSVLLIIVCLLLITIFILQKRRKNLLISSLGAPDYATAVKIQRLKLKDYAELQVEVDKAKGIITEGLTFYNKGQLNLASQSYEKALKLYSSYMEDLMVAETIFNIAWVQKDQGMLPKPESVMKLFPQSSDSDLSVNAFYNMLEAVMAEEEKNWGMANKAWQAALDYTDLEINYKAICQGSLVNLEFRDWLSNPIPPDYEKLQIKVEDWQELCANNNLINTLCWAYLTHARIALAAMQFDEAENRFNDCLRTAEEYDITYYQEVVQRETEVFEKHKNKIYALTREGEPISPSMQTQLVQEYLLKAKAIVKQDESELK
jgi:WD40 repeat protein